jgi:pimeloyl-ACP methyl ester carboxylesterase
VHGLGSRGEDWSGMIPTLAANGFHVYALDLLGYGRSSAPDVDYSIRLEEKTVADFMKAVKLDRADIGGWSMGGWVVLKLAVDHPDLVRRLVVYDAAGVYFPATFEGSLFTPSDRDGLFKLQQMLTPEPKPMPGFIADAAIEKLQGSAWVLDRSVASMTGGKDLLDFQLHRIEKPTLIVWGSEDVLIPLAAGQTMHRKIPGSNMLVVDGCGHLAPSECSKPVTEGTVDFLKAVPPERGIERTVAGH